MNTISRMATAHAATNTALTGTLSAPECQPCLSCGQDAYRSVGDGREGLGVGSEDACRLRPLQEDEGRCINRPVQLNDGSVGPVDQARG